MAAKPATTGFTFGAPSSAPPFGAATTPAFGATAAPAFGATAAPAFGATTATPAFGPVTAAPAFGTATATPAFGAVAAVPAFGTATTPAFGASAPAFGAPSLPGFGASSAPAGGTFTFGSTAPTASTGLNFGAPSTSSSVSFGSTITTAAPPSGFNFGGVTASAPTSLGFSFGSSNAPSTTTNSFGLGSNLTGLFGKPIPTQSTDKPGNTGLGGVDASSGNIGGNVTGGGVSGTGTSQSTPAPRSVVLPMELLTTIETFKANVRQCKQLSSDIARCSIRPLHKVQNEADSLLRETHELTADLTARKRTANNLRIRAGNALPAAERAHRIAETPHGLEYESGDVVSWITEVVAEGENRLILLRRQLEAAQKQLDASHKPITDEELALGMRRIHESFIAVAGRLQSVHQQVEAQKAQYLALRRNILKDPTDIFVKKNSASTSMRGYDSDWLLKNTGKSAFAEQPPSAVVTDPLMALGLSQSGRQQTTTGPNPFSNLGPPGFSGLPFGFNKTQSTAASCSVSLGSTWGSTCLQPGGTFPGVGTQRLFNTSFTGLTGADQSPFALQKPPAGNKRGKY